MKFDTAIITSYRKPSATKGDGRPTLGANLVPAPTRPIMAYAHEPSPYTVQTAAAQGIDVSLVCSMRPDQLRNLNITCENGDRLKLIMDRDGAVLTPYVIVRVRPNPAPRVVGRGDQVTVELKVARDGADD